MSDLSQNNKLVEKMILSTVVPIVNEQTEQEEFEISHKKLQKKLQLISCKIMKLEQHRYMLTDKLRELHKDYRKKNIMTNIEYDTESSSDTGTDSSIKSVKRTNIPSNFFLLNAKMKNLQREC